VPLPESTANTPWPPRDIAPYCRDQKAWAAWWSGDREELAEHTDGGGTTNRRRFWARRRPTGDATRATAQLHAPLAADIAATSADLLFGEPPDLLIPDVGLARAHARQASAGEANVAEQLAAWPVDSALDPTQTVQAQDRLDELADSLGLANRLLEAAEVCAATGGVYLRPVWDRTAADHPLLTVVDAEHGVPDFRYGQLVAVTFVEDVHREGVGAGTVWRHLERHEPGLILHGLYVGTKEMLGRQVPLGDHPSTAGLLPEIEVPTDVTGGRPGIMPRFVPNVLPNRRHRRYPIGRADIAGAEPFLDALDEAWSSWMRDLRLGQARLVVPDEFLSPVGYRPGSERRFSGYQPVGGPGGATRLRRRHGAVHRLEHRRPRADLRPGEDGAVRHPRRRARADHDGPDGADHLLGRVFARRRSACRSRAAPSRARRCGSVRGRRGARRAASSGTGRRSCRRCVRRCSPSIG
jgi:hypothetical protein